MEQSAIRQRPSGFAVCPHDTATAVQAWREFHARLNARFKLRTTFVEMDEFPAFEHALESGEFALAFLNPAHYAWARDAFGYVGVARPADSVEVARLISRRAQEGGMLTAGTVACVDVHLTTAALRGFRTRGVDLTPRFVESYAAVVEAVHQGHADYGIVYANYLGQSLTEEHPVQIALTQEVRLPHVLAVHPTLASHIAELQAFFFESPDAFAWTLELDISNWEPVHDVEYVASPREVATGNAGVTSAFA
jgi:phosphonate transport system substrate-binding protein